MKSVTRDNAVSHAARYVRVGPSVTCASSCGHANSLRTAGGKVDWLYPLVKPMGVPHGAVSMRATPTEYAMFPVKARGKRRITWIIDTWSVRWKSRR